MFVAIGILMQLFRPPKDAQAYRTWAYLGIFLAPLAVVVALVDKSEYKRRQAPPGIKITARAFGREIPLSRMLLQTIPFWIPWAAAAPLVLWSSERIRATFGRRAVQVGGLDVAPCAA